MNSDNGIVNALHVASFDGNIGDNANHNGTRLQLKKNISKNFKFSNREIRKHYKNYNRVDRLHFDDEFVKEANKHDLIVIGGGGFFDIWLDSSASGTTIDLSKSQIDNIDTPIVFNGLGCVPKSDVRQKTIDKFATFLDHLFDSPHCLVSVRNDGSVGRIRQTLGSRFADKIREIPDGGFFVEVNEEPPDHFFRSDTVIAMNVVSDMKELRFSERDSKISYDQYIKRLSSYLDELIYTVDDIEILFIPHIYSDFEAIYDVLSQMDLLYRRKHVQVAPYLHGSGKEMFIFGLYNKVDVSMGLRFHSNVCPIGLQTPSIGLANGHPKVQSLYDSLELSNRCISVSHAEFETELLSYTLKTLENTCQISDTYQDITTSLQEDIAEFHNDIEKLLHTR